jgi:hypothetical protein
MLDTCNGKQLNLPIPMLQFVHASGRQTVQQISVAPSTRRRVNANAKLIMVQLLP